MLGTDVRSEDFAGPAESEGENCLEDITGGKGNAPACDHGPYRSDTILLIRAGARDLPQALDPARHARQPPRPRRGEDQLRLRDRRRQADRSGRSRTCSGSTSTRSRSSTSTASASSSTRSAGIDVDLPTDVCSSVSGGAFNLDLKKGENHLNGFQAITLARTRDNTCSSGEFAGQGDLERAQFQQLILDGIKGKLTSITSLPMNFLKGPLIAWEAPKAMVSSMGGLTMPQLVVPLALGGGRRHRHPQALGRHSRRQPRRLPRGMRARRRELLGGEPPRKPNCPQG